MKAALLSLGLTVMTANAGLACGYKDYHIIGRGFAQGFQSNKQSTTTDCFLEVGQVLARVDSTIVSVTPEYYYLADWMRPVYKAQEVLLEWTRMMSACQTSTFAKQLESRVTSWAGVMDMIFNVIGSVAKWYAYTEGTGVYPDEFYTDPNQAMLRSPLMDAIMDMLDAETCAR